MGSLKDKVAVVTGASKGIGAAIAKRLSEAGAAVVVNYSSGKDDADRVVGANGGKAIAVKGDVAKAADMQQLFAETKKAFNRLDVLVNNAGVYKFLPLAEITDDEFHREFNINLLGTLLATKEAVNYFGPNGGSVINMNSIASAGEADASIYSGTKGAVDAITRALAAELGPGKIRVNAIAPGGGETEGTHSTGFIGSDFEKAMIASQSFIANEAKMAIDLIFDAAGGRCLQHSHPLQRAWRDVAAINHHISLNFDAVMSMYGQFVFGLPLEGQY
jgi:3-oxoacyl-[acyl-carrier protein] reductase